MCPALHPCSSRRRLRHAATTATLAASMLLMLLGTGSFVGPSRGAAAAASTNDVASSGQPTVRASHTKLGVILVDAKGMVLYRYTADKRNISNCYTGGGCVSLWPILTPGPGGRVAAGPGVAQSALAVITRKDGKKQVTYDGWPLYTYIVDQKPGQTTGQGFKDAQGIWFVVYATPAKNPAPGS